MKTFEYSPFNDVYVPYIAPEITRPNRMRMIWETLANTPLPLMTKWVLYNTLRSWR